MKRFDRRNPPRPKCGNVAGALGALAATIFLLAMCMAPAVAQSRSPLLMPGRKALHQRVLTRPGAEVRPEPASGQGKPLPSLSQLYVYERRQVAGSEWLAVGAGSRGQVDGWVRAEATLPWNSQMTLAFTNPAGRERTLLFAQRNEVIELLKASDPAAAAKPIYDSVQAGRPDPRVVSIEPATYIDFAKQFYLLPILEAQEVDTQRGFRVRVLEVASVTRQSGDAGPAAAAVPTPDSAAALRNFSAAVVFVIDSTISMGPYIERTRQAVQRIYETIERAGLVRQVRFGLIAYRSNVKTVPGLDYVTKTYVDPATVTSGKDFLAGVKDLQPAKVSSARFAEDPYAGLMAALKTVKWASFGGRYIVLITDAGAIGGKDPLSTTGLDAQQVRLELERLGIAAYALHLKTPEGKADHRGAEAAYTELTLNPVVKKPLYYPVEAGSVERFGAIVDTLAGAIVAQVQGAAQGQLVPGSARSASGAPADSLGATSKAAIEEDARLVGLAMQLAYLGRAQGTAAPPLFRAWLADRAFADLDRPTTEVRVLLTKNQLSDLAQVVEAILKAGDESQVTSTAGFFDLLRSAAAHLARDPAALKNPQASKLGELGLFGEYLDDLPYKSDVMALTPAVWTSWSVTEQEELLDKLRRKLRLYRVYNDDVDRWVKLAPGADAGDAVYPVPLTALP